MYKSLNTEYTLGTVGRTTAECEVYFTYLCPFYFVPETSIAFVMIIIIMRKIGEQEEEEEMEAGEEEREEMKRNGVETVRFGHIF